MTRAKKNDPVYRLEDIEVEEVSMVDRPANKRKFLVVKQARSESMHVRKGTELTPDGKGGFITSASGIPATQSTETPAATEATTTEKAAVELPPGMREGALPVLQLAAQKLEELVNVVDKSKPAKIVDGELPEGAPAEVGDAITSVIDLLQRVADRYPTSEAPPLDEGADPAAAGADAPPADATMNAKRLEKAARIVRTDASMVAKVGAKMSKERLSRFRQALSVLASMLTELEQPNAAAPAGDAAKAKAKKSDDADSLEKAMKTIADLSELVKKQSARIGDLTAKVTAVTKSRSGGNALAIDPAREEAGSGDVSWPMDMSRDLKSRSNA